VQRSVVIPERDGAATEQEASSKALHCADANVAAQVWQRREEHIAREQDSCRRKHIGHIQFWSFHNGSPSTHLDAFVPNRGSNEKHS